MVWFLTRGKVANLSRPNFWVGLFLVRTGSSYGNREQDRAQKNLNLSYTMGGFILKTNYQAAFVKSKWKAEERNGKIQTRL